MSPVPVQGAPALPPAPVDHCLPFLELHANGILQGPGVQLPQLLLIHVCSCA